VLTDDQVDRVFRLTMGVQARWADIQVAKLLGGTPDHLGSYIWDHWFGEPEEPTEAQVQTVVKFIVEHPALDDEAAVEAARRVI
jgi:hypothetical protein